MTKLPKFLADLTPDIFMSDNYLVLDFETDTSHGDFGAPIHPDNHLHLACWKHGKAGVVKRLWGSEFDMDPLLADIEKADFIVAHNAKYELGWLKRCGADLRKVFAYDTKIGEYVLLGNRAAGDDGMTPLATSLDMCCRRRGLPIKDPVVDKLIKDGVNPVRIPKPWLGDRCVQDVLTTEAVFLSQREQLSRMNLLAVQYTRCLLTPVLADIESEGMGLSPERVDEEYVKATAEMAQLTERMNAMTGGINWRSAKQAGEFLYDVLKFRELRKPNGTPKRNPPSPLHPEGSRLTDQKSLALLKAETPAQAQFIELRKQIGKVNALLTKNLSFFKGVCNEYNGTFFAEINQTKTATHRESSTGIALTFDSLPDEKGRPTTRKVQFQNTPRKLKRLFRAKRKTADGRPYLMADPDGSQLEFRVAAELGNDAQAIADIEDPTWDAHVTSAAAMEGKSYDDMYAAYRAGEKWAEEARQNAKSETFKPLYGGRRGTPKQERWYKQFRLRYPGIANWQERNIEQVVQTKRLITPWGLRFYWPYAKRDQRSGYVNVTTAVCNYPVQCLATAEIIPIALVYLWHRIGCSGMDEYMRMVNTVHDSAPTEVHPDHVDKFKELAKQAFTHDVYAYLEQVYGMDFKVPLGVGLKVGEHLGEGKEESWNVWKSGKEVKVK